MFKRVRVHLTGGTSIEHELEVPHDDAYSEQVNSLVDHLRHNREGVLVFTSPTLGIYPYQGILGIEFMDPLPPDKRPPVGFRPPSS